MAPQDLTVKSSPGPGYDDSQNDLNSLGEAKHGGRVWSVGAAINAIGRGIYELFATIIKVLFGGDEKKSEIESIVSRVSVINPSTEVLCKEHDELTELLLYCTCNKESYFATYDFVNLYSNINSELKNSIERLGNRVKCEEVIPIIKRRINEVESQVPNIKDFSILVRYKKVISKEPKSKEPKLIPYPNDLSPETKSRLNKALSKNGGSLNGGSLNDAVDTVLEELKTGTSADINYVNMHVVKDDA